MKNLVKSAARRAESSIERATGVRARDVLRQRAGDDVPGGRGLHAGAKGSKSAKRTKNGQHGEAGATPIPMPQDRETTRRVRAMRVSEVLEAVSAFDGVTAYYYEGATDIIRVATTAPVITSAVGSFFTFAAENAFDIVPVPLSRGSRAPRSLAEIEAELLGRRASRFQLVDERSLATPFSIQMECWAPTEEGHFGTPRNNNLLSRIWNVGASGLESPFDLHEALPGRALFEVDFDIDWVFTWVNGQDPDWQELYRQWAPEVASDASDGSRFEHRDDLMFALRSLDEYAPWIRRIHVVSNCEPPSWLDLDNDRIRWVWHEELFAEDELPTFSSHAIETTLHKIPGLAEHFVYSNDDFYLARRATPEDFFTGSGLCLSKLEGYGMVNGGVTEGDPDYLNAARNSGRLLLDEFGGWPVHLHTHSPQSLRVSVIQEMEEKYSEDFLRTRSAKFRSASDIAVSGFLFHHYAYATGRGLPVDPRTQLIQQNHNFQKTFAALLRDRNRWSGSPKLSFCVNDGRGSMENGAWNKAALEFLCSYFPAKSQFEK